MPVCTPACTDSPKIDPNLQRLIDAWPTLAEAIRLEILTMIDAAQKAHHFPEGQMTAPRTPDTF